MVAEGQNMESVYDLLDWLNEFRLDLDSEYYDSFEKMALGRARALRSQLRALGFTDLASELDGLPLEEGNIINILEFSRGFVIPEARRRLKRLEEEGEIAFEPLWDILHPRIRSVAKNRFKSGHLADAVEASLKEVNSSVKAIARDEQGAELDGSRLMNRAFSVENPIIRLADTSTESGRSIQQGFMQIFAGAMTGIRNPNAHANLETDRAEAIHLIYLASLLMLKLDARL